MPNEQFVAYKASSATGHGILIPNNLARALIFPDTQKHRLTQSITPGKCLILNTITKIYDVTLLAGQHT